MTELVLVSILIKKLRVTRKINPKAVKRTCLMVNLLRNVGNIKYINLKLSRTRIDRKKMMHNM